MLQTFRCFNCCGLPKESVYYEEICPNCGSLMSLPSWNLRDALRDSGNAAWDTVDRSAEFVSIGNLLSDEDGLLSYATNRQYLEMALEKLNVVAVFARPDDLNGIKLPDTLTPIVSEFPQVDFFLFHNWLVEHAGFYGPMRKTREEITNIFSQSSISAMGVEIADDADIYPGTVILAGSVIERGATIAPGAVIGVSGARLIRKPDGTFFRALHGGSVYIGEGAHIGANSVIVCSMWRRPTTIGAGAFIGNLVNVGHNVQIKPGAIVLPGVMLSGRSEIAETGRMMVGSMTAPGVRVEGTANLGAVVTKDVSPDSQVVSGNFAVVHEAQIRHVKELAASVENKEVKNA